MTALQGYVGLHQPSDIYRAIKAGKPFERCCLSINRLRGRKKPIPCPDVLVDSAAFTELDQHGRYRHDVAEYAAELRRLHDNGIVKITAAVAQDYMCESFMLAKTGLTVTEHQRLTIKRYDSLVAERLPFHILPVLQGYAPAEYVAHLRAYGARLTRGMWVGVGSVCKRNAKPEAIMAVLHAIKTERPDLRLHGFGVKATALKHAGVRALLSTFDSLAWSFAARKQGRDANDWREARGFIDRIDAAIARPLRPLSPLSPLSPVLHFPAFDESLFG